MQDDITVLLYAVNNEHFNMVNMLLKHGANPDHPSKVIPGGDVGVYYLWGRGSLHNLFV